MLWSLDGKPLASHHWQNGSVSAVAQVGFTFVFQSATEQPREPEEPVHRMVERTGLPLSYTLHQRRSDPQAWRRLLDLTAQANAAGLPMRGQVICRPTGLLFGLELSMHPFSGCPSYAAISDLPFAEKVRAMRDQELRARLIAEEPTEKRWALTRDFALMFPLDDPPDYEPAPNFSIANQAKRKGVSPAEIAYDLLLSKDGRAMLLAPIQDYEDGDGEATREMMEHPDTILGLGDAGAHCGLVCDASYSTWALTHWTRDRTRGAKLSLPWIIRALTSETAAAVGLHDRGIIEPGYKADLNVIDYDGLRLAAPEVTYDLPAGGRRIVQRSSGYEATVVSGKVTYRNGQHTGALPGRLIRGARAARA
ncbi:MAG: amidohydrolase family protein [Sphingomonadales bacterium]